MKILITFITLFLLEATLAGNESKTKKQVKRAHDENRSYGGFLRKPALFSAPVPEGGFVGIRHGDVKDHRKSSTDQEFGRQFQAVLPISSSQQNQGGLLGAGNHGGAATDLVGGGFQEGNFGITSGLSVSNDGSQGNSHGNNGGAIGINFGGADGSHGGSQGDGIVTGIPGFQGGTPIFQGGSDGSSGTSSSGGPGGLTEDNSGLTGGLGGAYGGGYGIGLGGLVFGGPLGPVFAGNTALEGGPGASDEDENDSEDEEFPPLKKKRPVKRPQFDSFPARVPPKSNSESSQEGGARLTGALLKPGGNNQGLVIPNQLHAQLLTLSGATQSNFRSNVFKNQGSVNSNIPRKPDQSSALAERIASLKKSFGEVGYVAFIFPKTLSKLPKSQNITKESSSTQTETSGSGTPKTTVITKAVTYPIPQPIPVEIKRPAPYIVPVPIRIPVDRPYPVPVPQAYAVQVARPYPVTVPKLVPVPIHVADSVPFNVPNHVPMTVSGSVEVPKPYKVDVPVFIRVDNYGGDAGYIANVGSNFMFEHSLDSGLIQRRQDKVESIVKKSKDKDQ